jgi:hypothetical protein
MVKLIHILGWMLFGLILLVPKIQAQQNDQPKNDPREQPVAPYPAFVSSGGISDLSLDSPQAPTTEVQVPAVERPPSGVQELNLSPNLAARNFLVPSVNVTSQLATSSTATGFGSPSIFNYLLGNLDLSHVSDRSQLLVHYTGGGMLSSYVNSAIQDLEFSYDFRWQRWSLLVGDQSSYLSESSFGFGGVGGLEFLNGNYLLTPGGLLLDASLNPNQTIPTIIAPRLSQTVVSQIEYTLSPRSSVTASGSFGMLNFLGAGYINSINGLFQTGYNYLLSPQSSIAVIYRFDAFRFTNLPQGIEDHVVELGYGRYVTGRLSFRLAAGPSLEMLRGALTGSANQLSWALDSSLNYQRDRTNLLLSYYHLISGGGGVLDGAQTGQVMATLGRKLSSKWQASASLGYAINRALIPAPSNTGNGVYNSWYAAVRFTHHLRPGASYFLGYGVHLQPVKGVGCAIPICTTNSIGHEISAGFNFDLRPVSFQ